MARNGSNGSSPLSAGLSTNGHGNSRQASPSLRPGFSGTGSYRPESVGVAHELHPVFSKGKVAVITGGASGIGRAAGIELAK
jgi:hypothetical protein